MLTSTRTVALVFPGWQVHVEHDHDAAYRAFEPVIRAVASLSPLVHVHSAGIALFAARGPSRYFGGDVSLAQVLNDTVARVCGAHTRLGEQKWGIGVADGRVAALVAARLACRNRAPVVVPAGSSVEFLAQCPVTVLSRDGDIPVDTVGVLSRLGLRTLGAVAGLSEVELVDRFGATGEQVHRIVNGCDVHMLVPESPPADFIRQHEFEEPVHTSGIVIAALRHTCTDLVLSLENMALQCVRLQVLIESDHGERSERMWQQPRGFTAQGILERLRWQLDGWATGDSTSDSSDDSTITAGIVRVQLVPVDVRLLDAEQQGLWGSRREHDERAWRAVTQALAVHPDVNVTVPEWRGGRDVASAFVRVPVDTVDLRDKVACVRRVTTGNGVPEQWSGVLPVPSPSTVYTVPIPVRLCDPKGGDVMVSGRHELTGVPDSVRSDTATNTVLSWAGPWPVEERWWDPRRRRRMARMQVLVEDQRTHLRKVLLLVVENKKWAVAATYN